MTRAAIEAIANDLELSTDWTLRESTQRKRVDAIIEALIAAHDAGVEAARGQWLRSDDVDLSDALDALKLGGKP